MNYKGKYIYPGFIDAHTHPSSAANFLGIQFNCYGYRGKEGILNRVKEYIQNNPDKNFYYGMGFTFDKNFPNAHDLDEICSNKVIVLKSLDAHQTIANSIAMEIVGLNKDNIYQFGNTDNIICDNEGNPIGLFLDEASISIGESIIEIVASDEDPEELFLLWQDYCFKNGITSVGDALVVDSTCDVYEHLLRENRLKLRTYGSYYIDEAEGNIDTQINEAIRKIEKINKNKNDYFQLIGIKFFIDGVIDAETAWLKETYIKENNFCGIPRICDHKMLTNAIINASNHGLNVQLHSMGDAATEFSLNCFDEALLITENFEQRNILAHLQLITKEDIKRIARNNLIALTCPFWIPKNVVTGGYYSSVELNTIGAYRAENSYPVKSIIEEGSCLCYHSDYPVSSMFSPINGFAQFVSRSLNIKKGSQLLNYDEDMRKLVKNFDLIDLKTTIRKNISEQIDRKTALKTLTINPAYAFKQENKLGSISVNKIANFTILDNNLLEDDLTEICENPVYATIVDAEEVYRAL